MGLFPSKAFPDMKKKKLSGEENRSSTDWRPTRPGCCSAAQRLPLWGPRSLQESGRTPLFQHTWLSLATILPGNIITGLRRNHLSVLGVCFSGVCVFHKQDHLLVIGVVKSLTQSLSYPVTSIMFRYLCLGFSGWSVLIKLNTLPCS